ncbi:MAG: hypothetical protein GX102_04640 [Porphyromonadaceae bacterium]|jgi:hypothetical protein|nr:hypothetical protein [Porphyromonadaceae bacterium]
MAGQGRPIAMGVSAIKIGATGDGVPGTVLEALPNPLKNAVSFNFADPTEVKIEIEGSDVPLYSSFKKDSTDYVEFSIPTPDNETIAKLMGGTHDTTTKDLWKEAVTLPSINQTFLMESEVHNGKKVVYTIVNGKVVAKLGQAPTADNAETILVRVYKQAAISEAGVTGYAFSREVVAV